MNMLCKYLSLICLTTLFSVDCAGRMSHRQRAYTYAQLKKVTSSPAVSPVVQNVVQPTEVSLITDAARRIKACNSSDTERIVCTYSFSGNNPLKISTKKYSTNWHKKPTTCQLESYNANQKTSSKSSLKQFMIVYKSCNPEQISFLEKDPKFNSNVKRSSFKINSSYNV